MTTAGPISFVYQDGAFRPAGRYAAEQVAARYGDGQVVKLVEYEPRSRAHHNWFFVAVTHVFENLTDEQRLLWPTEEALRKYALCKAGCCDVATHVCSSKAEAERLAGFLRSHRMADLVVHDGSLVTALSAWSMKYREMSKTRFRECVEKTLPILADIIGVEVEALEQARAA
jgi:hypothetical protein